MTHDTPADVDTFSQLLRHELAFLAESLDVTQHADPVSRPPGDTPSSLT
jgi:hypothetical protein